MSSARPDDSDLAKLLVLAHDMRQPLTVILANVSYLAAHGTVEEQRQVLADLREASRRLNRLVDQLAAIAKGPA